jgi:hypothetical protein
MLTSISNAGFGFIFIFFIWLLAAKLYAPKDVGIGLMDSFIFAGIGFDAHLFEDALVFNSCYSFFWAPIHPKVWYRDSCV